MKFFCFVPWIILNMSVLVLLSLQIVESSPRGEGYTDEDVTLSQLVRPQSSRFNFQSERTFGSVLCLWSILSTATECVIHWSNMLHLLILQNLIDLAGSESSKTETTGLRRKEGSYINKSLLTLGTVRLTFLVLAQFSSDFNALTCIQFLSPWESKYDKR